jgi:gliding motility-associated-like protein
MKPQLTIVFALFCLSLTAQVKFKVKLLSDNVTYQVLIKPEATWSAPLNAVPSAQVTVRVPTGGFTVSSVTGVAGNWSHTGTIVAPSENPGFDYLNFGLQGATSAITFNNGVEVPLFTFKNTGSCTGELTLINHSTDPFMPPNSQSVNVGNAISVIGAGIGVNAYTGNYTAIPADCTPASNCGIEVFDVILTSPSACGVADGKIEFVATSTGLPLQYSINYGNNQTTWQSSPIFPNLASGDLFRLAVRDIAAICLVEVGDFELDGPLAAVVLGVNVTQPGCGQSNGSVMINAVPDNGGVLQYAMNQSGPWQSSNTFSGLAQGIYSFWVRDIVKNCSSPVGTYSLNGCSSPSCLITYDLQNLGNGKYQVNLTSDTTWVFPNNITGSLQVTLKVPTGGFVTSSVESQLSGVQFGLASNYVAPSEDPAYDYVSFILENPGTQGIPYVKGDVIPLFTFENTGSCNGDSIRLMKNDDPFFPPNSQSANVGQQISVSGYGGPDIPVCLGLNVACESVPPPPPSCLITYTIEKLPSDEFQISMTSDTTWTLPNNITGSMQVTVKVPTGGFVVSNLTSKLSGVNFDLASTYVAPTEDPASDYISFILASPGTQGIPYQKGVKTPLFTFKNSGSCQNGQVTLMNNDTDPFFPPNSQSAGVGQQITVSGYGAPDAPICLENLPADDCTNDPCAALAPGFQAQDACQNTALNLNNTTTSIETITSWSWDFGDNSALSTVESPSHTFVSSGNFEVSLTVTTQGGCEATFSEFVTVFPSPGAAPIDNFVVCNGVGDTLQSPANISSAVWSPATGLDDPNSLTPYAQPSATTVYTLTATNDFGCEATSQVTVEVSNKPVIKDVVKTNQSDCGTQDASIFISALGDGALEYSLDNINWQTDSLFSNLAPADYTVYVRNVNGTCPLAYALNPVTITAPAEPVFVDAISTQPNGCAGDGSISVNATGGTAPLQYSIDGGQNFQASNVFNNLGGGTYNIVVANSNGSCEVTGSTVTLTEPTPPTIVTPVADFSICDGTPATVSIEISAPIADYIITGNGIFSNDSFNGSTLTFDVDAAAVGSTNFNVELTDGNGCSVTESFTLTGIAVPTTDFGVSSVLCTNGDVTINFTGNATPTSTLNWTLDGGQLKFSSQATSTDPAGATIVATWPASGQKTIGLTVDNQGCQASGTSVISITNYNPGATLDVTDAGCGSSTGSIDLNLAGTGTYTFNWSNGSSNQNLSNLSGGTYQVTITEDGSGCSATASAVVGASQPVSIASLSEEAATSCTGSNGDGKLTVEVSGGTSNYTVNLYTTGTGSTLIDQFTGTQSSFTFQGLAAGAYQVEVLDANGCSDVETTAITAQSSNLVATATIQNAACGANDGSFSINITGGNQPYVYDFYQNNQAMASNQTINSLPLIISNQAPGTSVLIIRDSNGCIVPVTAVVGSQQANFNLSASTNPAGCSANNGAILLNGVPAGATLSWKAGNGTSLGGANPLENLAAGVYSVTVTDAGGCTKTGSYVVTTAGGPQVTILDQTSAGCGSDSGSIVFEVSGSNSYSYNVMNTSNTGFGTLGEDITVNNLPAGAYVIEVTGLITNCKAYAAFIIDGGGGQIFASSTITKASACGVEDGLVEIEITGGTGPYTITSNQGIAPSGTVAATATVTGLYEGIVTITITDATGCTKTVTANMGDFIEPVLTLADVSVTNYTCPGEFGSIAAIDPAQEFQIFDQNNSFMGVTPWMGATAGMYTIRYTLNGCTTELDSVMITGPADWNIGLTAGPETCAGNDGFITLNISGANGSYSFAWSNGDTTATASDLTADLLYDVTITDSLGCTTEGMGLQVVNNCTTVPCDDVFYLDTFYIQLLPGFTEVCLPTELPDLSIFDLNLDGSPYDRDIESCIDSTIFYGYGMLLGLGAPPYLLEEWNYRGQTTEGFMFNEIVELLDHMNEVDPLGNWLVNDDDKSINGGASNSNYGSLIITHINSATTLNLQVNTVSVSHPSITVTNEPAHIFIVSDPVTGCKDTLFINVVGIPTPQTDTITVEVGVGETETVCLSTAELAGTPELLNNICISFNLNAQLISQGNECFDVVGLDLGPEEACMVLCDNMGNCDTTIVLITVVDASKELVIYNGFSPNGDGVNDFFRIKNIDLYPNNSLTIFNRWGSRVYTAEHYNNTWDAIYRNTKLPDGSYFYILEVEIDGKMKEFTGYVQVNR